MQSNAVGQVNDFVPIKLKALSQVLEMTCLNFRDAVAFPFSSPNKLHSFRGKNIIVERERERKKLLRQSPARMIRNDSLLPRPVSRVRFATTRSAKITAAAARDITPVGEIAKRDDIRYWPHAKREDNAGRCSAVAAVMPTLRLAPHRR